MAEGVVSEPLLPFGDQGHKGGFATLPRPPKLPRIGRAVPSAGGPHLRGKRKGIWRQPGDVQKLDSWPDEAESSILESCPPAGVPLRIWMPATRKMRQRNLCGMLPICDRSVRAAQGCRPSLDAKFSNRQGAYDSRPAPPSAPKPRRIKATAVQSILAKISINLNRDSQPKKTGCIRRQQA